MTEDEKEIVNDIFDNHDNLDKISVELNTETHDVVIRIQDLDNEWFRELKEANDRAKNV